MVQNLNKIFKAPHRCLLAALVFGFWAIPNSFADEPLQIYDLGNLPVHEIRLQVNDGTGFLLSKEIEDKIKKRIISYFSENLSQEKPLLEIKEFGPQKECLETSKLEKFSQDYDGVLFIHIHIFEASWMKAIYGVEIDLCHSSVGVVNLNFPEDWLEKFPQSPVRLGDCIPRTLEGNINYRGLNDWANNPEILVDYVFCRVKPDLNFIVSAFKVTGAE